MNKEVIINNPNLIKQYDGYDEELFKLAIINGYKPNEDDLQNNFSMCYSDSIMLYLVNIKPSLIKYYEGTNDDIFNLAIKNGYIPSEDDLNKFPSLCYNDLIMSKVIDKNYTYYTYYKGNNIEIILKAITNGYQLTEKDLLKFPNLGKNDDIMKNTLKNNISLAKYYSGKSDEVIKIIINHYLGNIEDIDNYISAFKICTNNQIREYLIILLNKDIINKLNNINIKWHILIRYALRVPKMKYLIDIIKNNNLDDFLNKYLFIKAKYYHDDFNTFGIDRFLNISYNYIRYNSLINELVKSQKELNSNQLSNLYYLFDSYKEIKINSINELDNIGHKIDKETINPLNNNLTSTEIKNIILLYMCNHTYEEIKYILGYLINYDTLDKMSKKYNSLEVSTLKVFMSLIEEVINSTESIESLKNIVIKLIENKELVDKIRPYFYNLEERIRNVYEIDANNTLTNFNNLPNKAKYYQDKYISKKTGIKIDLCDLTDSKYAIYAHVCSTSLYDLVNPKYQGRVFISTTPISSFGKKFFMNVDLKENSDEIIVGYTFVPKGSFIASSNNSLTSNFSSTENNYQLDIKKKINQLEFYNSSATPYLSGETILFRDGLVPSCIIIKGDNATDKEIEAAAYLSNLLDKKIPVVKTPRKNKTLMYDKENKDNSNVDELLKLKEILLSTNIEKSEVSNIIRIKAGGSHDMYRCIIDGKRYLLKSGRQKHEEKIDSYRVFAMECGYNIQALVNPTGAVKVKTVSAPLGNNNEMILCSAIEEIENIQDYSWMSYKLGGSLSQEEIRCFLKEFIVDYLLYNYDSKLENFIKNDKNQVYGIDKEQSLKYILNFVKKDEFGNIKWNTDMTYSFNPNNVSIIYDRIFTRYINNLQEIDDNLFYECFNVCEKLDKINDEKYLSIFKNYVESYCFENNLDDEVKKTIYNGILIRKKRLKQSFNDFVDELKEKRLLSKKVR